GERSAGSGRSSLLELLARFSCRPRAGRSPLMATTKSTRSRAMEHSPSQPLEAIRLMGRRCGDSFRQVVVPADGLGQTTQMRVRAVGRVDTSITTPTTIRYSSKPTRLSSGQAGLRPHRAPRTAAIHLSMVTQRQAVVLEPADQQAHSLPETDLTAVRV